jgi:hypothetical protein
VPSVSVGRLDSGDKVAEGSHVGRRSSVLVPRFALEAAQGRARLRRGLVRQDDGEVELVSGFPGNLFEHVVGIDRGCAPTRARVLEPETSAVGGVLDRILARA